MLHNFELCLFSNQQFLPVLGQLSPRKIAPNPNRGAIFLGGELSGHRFYQDMMQISNNPTLKKIKYTPTHVPTISAISKQFFKNHNIELKDPLPGLGQFQATESSLKMIENAFYFTLKALFAFKIFKFMTQFFEHIEHIAESTV